MAVVEVPVSDTDPNTAPLDGFARFAASRVADDKTPTTPVEPQPDTLQAEKPPQAETPAEPERLPPPAAAAVSADAVLDPETGQPIENPTRNDRRIAKLWKREQEALAEAARLRTLLEQRNAAPLPDPTQTAGRPAAPALTPDEQLTQAAKARLRPKPDVSQIGEGKPYPDWDAYNEDLGIWGGELAVEKRAIVTDMQTRQQAAQTAYTEQAKAYPDWDQRLAESQHLKVGSAIMDVLNSHPEVAGHLNYWVMTHHADVARISALPVAAAYVEMGKVLASLETRSTPEPVTPKLSRAPAPTRDIGRPAGQISTDPANAKSFMEFAQLRGAPITLKSRVR